MKKTPGSPENTLTLKLSTGYEVEIDLLDAREGLQHLARALMGEIMFPKLTRSIKVANKSKVKPGWTPGIEAAVTEISKIVKKCDKSDLRALLISVIWAYLMGEFDRIHQKENAGN